MQAIQIEVPEYHAHIYFDAVSRASAVEFRELINVYLAPQIHYYGNLIDRAIGPHPVPMFEVNFRPQHFAQVVSFLMQNHGSHSVLIHPYTGNDLLDHTVHALWLGKQLPLVLDRL